MRKMRLLNKALAIILVFLVFSFSSIAGAADDKTTQAVSVTAYELDEGDAYKCFDGTASEEENLHLAELYWENGPNADGREKIHEILVDGNIEILKIVKVMNANIPES